jgi:UDP-N-acetylmuramate--alanine ligase
MRNVRRVHFVGIGGAGMSALAEILHASGVIVSGTDQRESATLAFLRQRGVRVAVGHGAEHIGDADVVVVSTAVAASNPEVRAAEARRIPVIPRAELLAELMRMKHGVAVAGSHGKTSTTSMIGAMLMAGGLDPTICVGGRVHGLGGNARLGAGDVFVAESDESDGSFLRLMPTVVAITNIDREHLDHYTTFERLELAFLEFANRVPFWGLCVLCIDDPHVRALWPRVVRPVRTYGLAEQAEVRAEAITPQGLATEFRVHLGRRALGHVRLPLPGLHYVSNALAAISVALAFDVSFTHIAQALAEFRGVERRFEVRGERDGVVVIDDYAHHPAEIRATLAAARQAYSGRVLVAFQPHRYTRTRDLFLDLAGAFGEADVLLLTEIYAAGEAKIPGVEARALAERARTEGHREVYFEPERADLVPRLRALARPGDAVVFMGAGDIGRCAGDFLGHHGPEGGSAD